MSAGRRRNRPPPDRSGRAFQFRLTRIVPWPALGFVRDTVGAALVSVTLLNEIGSAGSFVSLVGMTVPSPVTARVGRSRGSGQATLRPKSWAIPFRPDS